MGSIICGSLALMSRVIDATKRTIAVPLAGVIALVPDEWGIHWTGRHDTLTRVARRFRRC